MIWLPPLGSKPIPWEIRDGFKQIVYEMGTFDILLADPPWKIGVSSPTRGLTLEYETVGVNEILSGLKFEEIVPKVIIFMWIPTPLTRIVLENLHNRGWEVWERLVWVKRNSNGKLTPWVGPILLRSFETCWLFRRKGDRERWFKGERVDIIFEEKRNQSQKPEALYEVIEKLAYKGARKVEIFVRVKNLRSLEPSRTFSRLNYSRNFHRSF